MTDFRDLTDPPPKTAYRIPDRWAWPDRDRVSDLKPGRVDVWLIRLQDGDWDRDSCWPVLSEQEQNRSRRFKHPGAREEYVISRGLLRILLSEYVGIAPSDLVFRTAPRGKPFLASDEGLPVPEFNMTHSHGVGLYAFATGQAVGIDVEMVERKTAGVQVAKRFFTEREARKIADRPEVLGKEAFLRSWVCKEACLKWTGAGLSGGLKTHEILFSDAWRDPKVVGEGPRPALHFLEPGDKWVGAVATDVAACVQSAVYRRGKIGVHQPEAD